MNINKTFIFIFILALALGASVSIYKGLGASDNTQQVPVLKRMLEPDYLTNDWFVNVENGYTNIRYHFHLFVSAVYKVIPSLAITYYLLFVAACFLTAHAVYLNSYLLFGKKRAALLTAFLVLFGASFTLGGNFILHDILTPYALALPLAFYGFYFFMRKNYFLFCLMFGISSLFHIHVGIILFGIIWSAGILSSQNKKEFLFKTLRSFPIFLLFIVLLYPVFDSQVEQGAGLSGKEIIFIMGLFKHPHHFIPSQFPIYSYVEFVFFLLIFLFAFQQSSIEREKKKLVVWLALLIFFCFLIGTVFVELIPISLIVKLQLFRLSTFLSFLGYLFIGSMIANSLFNFGPKIRKIFYFVFAISLFHAHLIILSFPLFVLYKFNQKRVEDYYQREINIWRSLLVLSFLIILIAVVVILKIDYFTALFISEQQSVWLLLFKLFLFGVVFLVLSVEEKYRKIIVLIVLILCTILVFSKQSVIHAEYGQQTAELYNFIKQNTPEDSVFLIPPYLESFRVGAERAVVVDFNFPFSEKAMVEWYGRILEVTNDIEFDLEKNRHSELKRGYNSLSEENIIELKGVYYFDYVLVEKPRELNFEREFENDQYILYNIGQEAF